MRCRPRRSRSTSTGYLRALAEFSVLAGSAHDGKARTPQLSAQPPRRIRCAYELARWPDCASASAPNLHGKYVRTHGRAESDTVDVAKRWAWALLNLREYRRAVAVYLQTADALWESDPVAARRLLGARRRCAEVDPAEFAQPLRHGLDLLTTIAGSKTNRRQPVTHCGRVGAGFMEFSRRIIPAQ